MLYVYHYPTDKYLLRRCNSDSVAYDGLIEPELYDVHAGGFTPEEAMQGIMKPAAQIGNVRPYIPSYPEDVRRVS